MTYIVDFTDEDGKRRTVDIVVPYDLIRESFAKTLAAFFVHDQKGIAPNMIHSITQKEVSR